MLIIKKAPFLLLLPLIFFIGCNVSYLVPTTPNLPLLDSTQVFNTDFTLTTNYSIEGKANIKFLKYGILQATVENKHVMFRKYNFFHYEFATGFNYSKNNFFYSLIGGVGQGTVGFGSISNNSESPSGNSHYTKYFIQPTFSYIRHNNMFGIAFKLGYYDYMVTEIKSFFFPENAKKILNKFYPIYSTEPTLFYRCNSKPFIYSIYLGFHSFLPSNREFRYSSYFSDLNYIFVGWGLGFYLDKGAFKKTIK